MRYLDQHTFDFNAEFYRDVHLVPGTGTYIKLNTRNDGPGSGASFIDMQSASDENGPLLYLQNTRDDDKGGFIQFTKSKTPADGDVSGIISFNGKASIIGAVHDASDGEGVIQLSVDSASGVGSAAADFWGNSYPSSGALIGNVIKGYGNGTGIVNVDLALGAASTTTIAGGISIGGHTVNDIDIGSENSDSDEHLMTSAAINNRIAAATTGTFVDLTSEVSGILPVSNGGTGASSLTDNKILTGTGTSAITAEANATYDGTDLTLISSTSTKPILSIENTTNDANAGELKLIGRRSTDASVIAANNDDTGKITFVGENNKSGPDPETITYGQILGEVQAVTDGFENGKMSIKVAEFGSLSDVLTAHASGLGSVMTFGNGNLLSTNEFQGTITNFTSTVSTGPIFGVYNYTDDATGPAFTIGNLRGGIAGGKTDGSDNDSCGVINFAAYDDGTPTQTTFAKIEGIAKDVSNGAEEGKLTLNVASHDGEIQPGLTIESGDAEDEVDVTIGNGSASVVTVPGFISIGGHAINDIDVAGEFVDSDEHLMTAAAINDQFGGGGGGVTADPFSTTVIKVLPNQWVINDDAGRPLFVEDDTSNTLGVRCFTTTDEMYAWQKLPSGYKATHVQVHASASTSSAVSVRSYNYQTGADNAVSATTGNLNANIDITDIPSSATQDLVIKVSPGSGSTIIFGATVTIATI